MIEVYQFQIGDKVIADGHFGTVKEVISDKFVRVYVADEHGAVTRMFATKDLILVTDTHSPKPKPLSLTAEEEIVKPQRYNKKGKLECWDVILDQEMGFLEGNIIKYIWRHKEKGGVADLKKAKVYLDKLISEAEKNGKV